MTDAVLADWRTAPVSDGLRATLGFLEKLTLRPDEIERADADEVRRAGVSGEALVDAIHVCALFNAIDRVADSLGFLEKLTLRPDEIERADADEVRRAGVSAEALVDAIHVCALFNAIDRVADSLGFHVPDRADAEKVAPRFFKRGYR